MSSTSDSEADEKRARRASLRVRSIPRADDIAGQDTVAMTPEARIGMMWSLAQAAWAVAGEGSDAGPRFRDMLAEFNVAGAEYLVVGDYALALHGYPRATGAMELWVRRSQENAGRVMRALHAFCVPSDRVTLADLLDPGSRTQIGREPNRVDIVSAIDGVEFEDAYPGRVLARIGDIDAQFVSLLHLLTNKRATGRPEDLTDASRLEASLRRGTEH